MNLEKSQIYIAGHTGLVGSALVRHFSRRDDVTLLLVKRSQIDLTRQAEVEAFLREAKPDTVIIAAGKVGGIQANSKYPADFIFENLMMEANLIHGAYRAGVKRLLNFGSSCVYPKECQQPMKPEHLMTGKMEMTNMPYGVAKMAGMTLCESYSRQYGMYYINAIPVNIYGPHDSFDLERCHVLAAFIRRLHEAKRENRSKVVFWGSGNVKRDFLFVDDFAKACEILLENYEKNEPINVGGQSPWCIRDLAIAVADMVEYKGDICWNASRPDGAPERTLDVTAIRQLGFRPETDLRTGLRKTYDWFLKRERNGL